MIAPGLSQYERSVIVRFVDEVDGGQKIFPEGQLAELAEVLFRLQLDDQKSKAVDITGCKASPRLRRAVQAAGLPLEDGATVQEAMAALMTAEAKYHRRRKERRGRHFSY